MDFNKLYVIPIIFLVFFYYSKGLSLEYIILLLIITLIFVYIIIQYFFDNKLVNYIIFLALLFNCFLSFFNNDWLIFIIMIILLVYLSFFKIGDILYNLANLFYNRSNNISLMFCNLAMKFGVNQSDIFKLKGDILLEKEDYEGAFECYKHVLSFENDSNTINDIAVSLEYMGKYDEALTYYDNSLNINPNNVLTLNNKAILLIKLKKYNEALSLLNKVLDIDENNMTAMENRKKIINKIK